MVIYKDDKRLLHTIDGDIKIEAEESYVAVTATSPLGHLSFRIVFSEREAAEICAAANAANADSTQAEENPPNLALNGSIREPSIPKPI